LPAVSRQIERTKEGPMVDWKEPAAVPARPGPDENWAGELENMVQFAERGIVSKTLVDRPELVNVSLFMMSTGQKMSSHAASKPATIHVLGGEGKIEIGDQTYKGKHGSLYYMPAGQPHALESTDDLVFLLYLLG
jgi:quercetin dioxygenase-like cupin family protein